MYVYDIIYFINIVIFFKYRICQELGIFLGCGIYMGIFEFGERLGYRI